MSKLGRRVSALLTLMAMRLITRRRGLAEPVTRLQTLWRRARPRFLISQPRELHRFRIMGRRRLRSEDCQQFGRPPTRTLRNPRSRKNQKSQRRLRNRKRKNPKNLVNRSMQGSTRDCPANTGSLTATESLRSLTNEIQMTLRPMRLMNGGSSTETIECVTPVQP